MATRTRPPYYGAMLRRLKEERSDPVQTDADTSRETILWDEIDEKPDTFPPSPHTHVEADITNLDRVRSRGMWEAGSYLRNDMAHSNGWVGVANKDTTDQLDPQRDGPAINLYSGNSPTVNSTSKLLLWGNRYSFIQATWINAYRIYVIAGNSYDVYSVKNPDTENVVVSLLSIVASTTGWLDFGINPVLALTGDVLDMVVVVREPDPAPTTFTGDWDYDTPNNAATPGPGVLSHANKLIGSLRIHKEDDAGADRSAELEGLNTGDVINALGKSWAIQTVNDNTTWMEFGVAPAEQASPDGVTEFTFETVTATPITYQEDPGWWFNNGNGNIQGILSLDGRYDNKILNINAYGIDLNVQSLIASPDWDLYSYSPTFDQSSASGNTPEAGQIDVGDLSFGSVWYDREQHGSEAHTIPDGIWAPYPALAQVGPSEGTTVDPVTGAITILNTGLYNVSLSASVVMQNNRDIDFGVEVVGQSQQPRRLFRLRDGGDAQTGAASCDLELLAGNVLRVVAKGDGRSVNVDPETTNFNVNRIR